MILKEKAMKIVMELNVEDFSGGKGWLERFSDKYCLPFKTICREAAAVDGNSTED